MSRWARRRARGVTLIELLITLVVAAIVMAVAVPSYRQYVLRANRADASAALLRIAANQERFFLQRSRYAAGAAELTAAPPDGLGVPTTERGYYRLAVDTGGRPGGYTATATVDPGGPQADDEHCWRLTIDETGQREAFSRDEDDTTDACWR